jgi:hypothetical protein
VGLFHSLLVFYSVFEQLLDPNYTTSSFNRFYIFFGFTLIPIKDFFIALLFSYLYFYQGKKQLVQKNSEVIETIENVFLQINHDEREKKDDGERKKKMGLDNSIESVSKKKKASKK